VLTQFVLSVRKNYLQKSELIEKKKQEIINSAKSLKKTIEQENTVTNKD